MTTQNLQLVEPPDYTVPGIAPEMRETFRVLDALGAGFMAVISATTTAPPINPPQGATYRVPDGATDAWSGHARHLAIWTQVGWVFRPPRLGWLSVVMDQNLPYGRVDEYTGTAWVPWLLPAIQVAFDTSQTDFVHTDLQSLLEELNDRLIADETSIFAELDDHEFRIGVLESGGGGGGGGGNVTPDTHPSVPNVADDEFETGSSIDLTGARFTGANAWAWRNQGTASGDLLRGSLILKVPSASSGLHVLEQTAPSAPWEYEIKARPFGADGNFFEMGFALVNNSNGRLVTFGFAYNSGYKMHVFRWTDVNTFSAAPLLTAYASETSARRVPWEYLRVAFNGTTFTFKNSRDGLVYQTYGTETLSTHLGSCDKIGVFADVSNGSDLYLMTDWFRRVS